ncbi:hypothetical protein D9V37_02890 [Nocardioides mangrovicus]|uniref:Uncharacterized protein n=1 Tax=Nocardioides mangrovicus TaxID=2478913 RepID=A0A3L8P666_9ACTN|nr:hypothetical protein [Nocardioides mangrovicus]RLV50906.1 hypothetical protein D9V37_02890 [Nocardioides mangrovicus]
MAILLWLVPAALATCAAMVLAGWLGRERTTSQRQADRAQQRFARAMDRPMPAGSRVASPRVRSTGIAVRAARRPLR